MNLSNSIAHIISQMLEDKSEIEIQRNILAQDIGCVPSQINYVLSSRFTLERGYMVESRRGGGGFIKITRIAYDKNTLLMQVINSIGEKTDEATAQAHIMNLLYHEIITKTQAQLLLAATRDKAYKELPVPYRDILRAGLLREMLLSVIKA